MSNINEQTCKWMQINGGEIVEFKDTITNPNPGSPVTVKFYLEKPLTSLEREWEFNDQITSIDLSKLNADDLASMKRTFYGTEKLKNVVLPNSAKLDVENLDVEQIISENGYKNVKWSGNVELTNKIYEELNYTPEEPEEPTYEEVKYEIIDNDEENWKQGEVHKLTVARISGTVESLTLTLTITGGSVKPTTIVDDKDDLSQEIEVTPESDSVNIILSVSDSELCSFVKNDIPEADDEEDEPSVDPENPSDDPSQEEKEPAKYELVSEDNNEWTQETEYSLTFRRVSGDVETPNEFTIEAEGADLDKYSLTDNGDKEYEETIVVTPNAETVKVEVKLEDEVVATFEKNDVKPTETPEQPEEKTPEEKLEEALEAGGEVEVNEPISIVEPLTVSVAGTSIVLNETITAEKSGLLITADATISGEGSINAGEGGNYKAVWVQGGNVKIEGGNFSVGADDKGEGNSCIFISEGHLEISGGHFETAAEYEGRKWVINKLNDSDATISITGGEFVGFNPAEPNTDDDDTYVAEGYEAVEHEGVWTVQLKQEVEPEEPSEDPSQEEDEPKLTDGVEGEYEMKESESINKSISITEGTLNLGENTLTIENDEAEYDDQIITVSGVSIISGGTINAKDYQGEAVLFKLEYESSLTVDHTHISSNTTIFSAPDSSQVRVTYAYCYCFGPGYLFYSNGGKFVIEDGVFSSETNSIFKIDDDKVEEADNVENYFVVQGGEFVGFNPKNAGAINEKWEGQSLLDEGLDVEENENIYKVVSKSDEEEEEETPDPSTDPSDEEENKPSDNPSEEEEDEDPSEDPSNEETEPSEEETETPSEEEDEEETPSEEEEDEPSEDPTPEE